MTRFRRFLAYTSAVIAALVIIAICIVVRYRRVLTTDVAGDVSVPGLYDKVAIARDSLGIPSITAHNEHDLLFAQGYVHAQDRLWQMELMRHVGEGRVAELFGKRVMDTDRFLHVFGVPRAAAAQEAALDATSRARIQAYVDGVNAYIGERHALPPEFKLLRVTPEKWTVRQTLAVEKVMALDLSQYFLALDRTRAVLKLGDSVAAALQPGYPSWGPTIIEVPPPPAVPPLTAALIGMGSITHASNAFVIGGARTKSHKPILANDMHLDLSAPPVWYIVALHIDDARAPADVVGMSLPGSPFVVAGHTKAIAWGLTNVMLDDADLFAERIDPTDSTRYTTPTGNAPFTYVTDTLRIKGGPDEYVHYRVTRHGPVISDVEHNINRKGEVIALRWVGADPSHTMLAMPALMRATNWNEFRTAVSLFDDPHQNVVYADTAGHFGFQMGGRIPDRGDHLPPSLPVPGWTGDWDWRGYIPFAEQPMVYDPPQGYVVTANNRQAAGALADRISDGWETPFRAARIREMILAASHPLTASDVHLMQLDVRDASALRYRDRAIDAARKSGNTDVAEKLTSWNGAATRASRAATTYYMFYDRLRIGLVRSLYGDSTGWIDRAIIDNVLEQRHVPWRSSANAFDSIAAAAMKEAIAIGDGREWGDVHHITAVHPMAALKILDNALHLNIGNEPGDGSPTTVNVSQWRGLTVNGHATQFDASVGPSQRHVVDLGNIDTDGGFVLPGGESGIPFSKHYRDQWRQWLDGGLNRIPLSTTAITAKSAKSSKAARDMHTMTLVPAGR